MITSEWKLADLKWLSNWIKIARISARTYQIKPNEENKDYLLVCQSEIIRIKKHLNETTY